LDRKSSIWKQIEKAVRVVVGDGLRGVYAILAVLIARKYAGVIPVVAPILHIADIRDEFAECAVCR
jgi:hypothetical protein